MNIFTILKGIIGAITLAILSLTGTGVAPTTEINTVASTTDSVVQQTVDQATTTTKDDVTKAYELGKAVGQLQERVYQLSTKPNAIVNQSTTTPMNNETTTNGAPTKDVPSTTAPATSSPTPADILNGPTQGTANVVTPVSLAHIDIISPIAGKGIGKRIDSVTGVDKGYVAADQVTDESNYIELGAIVYDDNGVPTDSAIVNVTASGQNQDKVLKGTGDVTNIFVNGDRKQVPVYSFHYEFRLKGTNVIVFTANGISTTVELEVK